jgi:hypothetical protein
MILFSTCVLMVLEISARAIRQEKEIEAPKQERRKSDYPT